ncbi:class I SAM-dependent methyltransferase [Marinobacterium sedimentorum]|uniref:class I SAM-dependent methyltransferase n=1 Tax=Marinobacterium sedimentorum TaxID=2927804 RepID=UPI0020C6EF88|nr:class I SAM-dependent methyltransferase [Marinobacterium sedimentorum]MCP8689157.1 class I SAM-dependent methyltransferase [Marinobacterium sedimentorum]
MRKISVRESIIRILPIADFFLAFLVYPAAFLLKYIRRLGVHRLPFSKKVLFKVGVFPIRNHYYEPQFDNRNPSRPFSDNRPLSGIDWNVDEQLVLLGKLVLAFELEDLSNTKLDDKTFYFGNGAFESGDAEYLYQIIRYLKPSKVYEIGSGNSTLIAAKAILKNTQGDSGYKCKHLCVEPYEMPWLEETGVEVVREKVEELPISFFSELGENDILFIDSSHIIRPQGDILFEYLELLPTLRKGVIVHVHDIFSPRNYPANWMQDEVKFWNEQYILEAFLSHNSSWEIIGALNYLHHQHYDDLKLVSPFLTPDREPGSLYIRKIA